MKKCYKRIMIMYSMNTKLRDLLYLVIGITVLFVIAFLLFRTSRIGISLITIVMIAAATGWCVYSARKHQMSRRIFGVTRPNWWYFLAFMILVGVLTAVLSIVCLSLFPGFTFTPWQQPVPWIFLALYLVISIPLQEFIFRGYIQSVLRQSTNRAWLVVFLTAFLFAIAHLHYGWIMVTATFILGSILSWLKLKTNSLAYVIAVHWSVGLIYALFF